MQTSIMATTEQPLERIPTSIRRKECCAEKFIKVARELESLKDKCNASHCVGTVGSPVFLFGAAAHLLDLVGVWCLGVAAPITEPQSHKAAGEIQEQFQPVRKPVSANEGPSQATPNQSFLPPQLLLSPPGKHSSQQLIKTSAIGPKTAAVRNATAVGGAAGMAFDSLKDQIKENHVTAASQSQRDTTSKILKSKREFEETTGSRRKHQRTCAESQRDEDSDSEDEDDYSEDEDDYSEDEDEDGGDGYGKEEDDEDGYSEDEDGEDEDNYGEDEDEEDEGDYGEDEDSYGEDEDGEDEGDYGEDEGDYGEDDDGEDEDDEGDYCEDEDSYGEDDDGEDEDDEGDYGEDEDSYGEDDDGEDEDDEGDYCEDDYGKDEDEDSEDEENYSQDDEDGEEDAEDDESKKTGRKKRGRHQQTQNQSLGRACGHKPMSSVKNTRKRRFESRPNPSAAVRVGLLNVQSMNNKRREVLEIITQNNLDVLCTTETWLQRHTGRDVLRDASPHGFSFHHEVRPCRGGGVAVQFLNTLLHKRFRFNCTITTFEVVATVLKHDEWEEPVLIVNVYRPPGSNLMEFQEFLDQFEELLKQAESYNCVIVTGDFNIWFDPETRSFTDEFLRLLPIHDFVQHVKVPTHEAGHILDLVFSRNVGISGVSVRDDRISDHYTVYFSVRPKPKETTAENTDKDEHGIRFKKRKK